MRPPVPGMVVSLTTHRLVLAVIASTLCVLAAVSTTGMAAVSAAGMAGVPATGIGAVPATGTVTGPVAVPMPSPLSARTLDPASQQVPDPASAPAPDPPPDPESDVLGWENGRWHNESIDVDTSDGLDASESARLLDRTMARVEYVRRVEFDEPVELNRIPRSEYAAYVATYRPTVSSVGLNVKFEALGFVGEDRDAVDVRQAAQTTGAAAFVSSVPIPSLGVEAGDVNVVVEENQTAFSEVVLAHELVHTLQFRQLGVSPAYGATTTEVSNANYALVEGEASHVAYLYERRCGNAWNCSTRRGPAPQREPAVLAMTVLSLVRYGNGAEFVAHLRDEGGWEAVADAHALPPGSTEQVIHPDRYRDDVPQVVTVADRSDGTWDPLSAEGRGARAVLGEAGLFTTLWYASVDAGRPVVFPRTTILDGSLPSDLPYDFGHEVTAGWDGDRLVPYVSDTAGANETGFVWRIEWDTPEDATEFRDAYVAVIESRGADPVADRRNTFRIPDDSPFGDAFYVERDGSSLVVVNAPTVAALSGVRAGAAPETAIPTRTTTPRATPTVTGTADATDTQPPATPPGQTSPVATGTASGPGATTAGESGPGFGGVVAVVAILAVAIGFLRRE